MTAIIHCTLYTHVRARVHVRMYTRMDIHPEHSMLRKLFQADARVGIIRALCLCPARECARLAGVAAPVPPGMRGLLAVCAGCASSFKLMRALGLYARFVYVPHAPVRASGGAPAPSRLECAYLAWAVPCVRVWKLLLALALFLPFSGSVPCVRVWKLLLALALFLPFSGSVPCVRVWKLPRKKKKNLKTDAMIAP